jgi:hypothetical protein
MKRSGLLEHDFTLCFINLMKNVDPIIYIYIYIYIYIWKMLDLQQQYNNCTTISHMRVSPTYWGPPSYEGLLCSCCIGVVQESNPYIYIVFESNKDLRIFF